MALAIMTPEIQLPSSFNALNDLFVMRHGRSVGQDDINAYKSIGDHKIPLSKKGISQASASTHVIKHYLNKQPLHVFFSTSNRTEQTARAFLENAHDICIATCQADPRLDKQKFGVFDGLFTDEERQAAQPEAYQQYKQDLAQHGEYYARPKDGESIADIVEKAGSFLRDVASIGEPVLVITHGLPDLCIEKIVLGHDEQWVLDRQDTIPNCGIRQMQDSEKTGKRARTLCDDPLAWKYNRPDPSWECKI